MFIDTARFAAQAGKGGDGAVAFHREKYVTAGGPDGGDGGRGGHIILQVDPKRTGLIKYKHAYKAEPGGNGGGNGCTGKNGEDCVIFVPRGTLVKDAETGRLLADMSEPDVPFLLCKGGRGGWGNRHFANSVRRTPRFAKGGLAGDTADVRLELKLLADVGLCGMPNAGKSTLLSVISAAKPKIGDYPFTTLAPNLGVVRYFDETFVCADIPGLIEGAAEGAGLGHDFLRHIDRCRLVLHLVDIAGTEGRLPEEDYDTICAELERYSPALAARPKIIAATKCDLLDDDAWLEAFREHVAPHPVFAVSAATHSGVDDLVNAIGKELQTLPEILRYEPEPVEEVVFTERETAVSVENGVYIVRGAWLERLLRDINLFDAESLAYFEKCLTRGGVYDRLREAGVQEGDPVDVEGVLFDYVE